MAGGSRVDEYGQSDCLQPARGGRHRTALYVVAARSGAAPRAMPAPLRDRHVAQVRLTRTPTGEVSDARKDEYLRSVAANHRHAVGDVRPHGPMGDAACRAARTL